MDDQMIRTLAWFSLLFSFVWLPFALTSWLVERWSSIAARAWRMPWARPLEPASSR